MEKEKLVYLISPVRQVTTEQAEEIAKYAETLKAGGVRLFVLVTHIWHSEGL